MTLKAGERSETERHRRSRDWRIERTPKKPGEWEQVLGGGFVRVGEGR
jgi:hypothetical protein